ncbi:MAG: hypothetical protein M0R06_03350 [Sphaerochaeta sp.]|jgi:hypothetical protein|nr:hypothetical protein [Sphaerochaeta sp.]
MADSKEKTIALLSATTIDLTTAAATNLYTVPTGKRCILHCAVVVCGSAASTTAGITIGQSTDTDDFLTEQTLTNLAAQYDAVTCMPVPNATPVKTKSYAAGTIIQCEVATADDDGSEDATLYLFGFIY